MKSEILIVDDEDLFREDLADILRHEGHSCRTAADGAAGIEMAEEIGPDVVLCDLMMEGISGLEVVERIVASCPETAILVMTAYGSMPTAVEAFRKGAVDYLVKPLDPESLLRQIDRCLEERRIRRELHFLRRAVAVADDLIGVSPAIREVRRLIEKVGPADSSVLVRGESGTGKELVARALHAARGGTDRPFIPVNCAAVPAELFESELFGHIRGAFTGAVRDRPGLFELARGGTLFLDEIGELPLPLQPKLLRALESGEFQPVGARSAVRSDARIVAATNRNLAEEVEKGRFRADLFYRIQVVEIVLPPLRERREDVPLLVDHLLGRLRRKLGRSVAGLDPLALRALREADWPGNVRELENLLERAVLLSEEDTLCLADFPQELDPGSEAPPDGENLRAAVRAFERRHISEVLRATDGNREEAAKRLGVDASTLYRRLKSLEI